jgi:hypothetical protein
MLLRQRRKESPSLTRLPRPRSISEPHHPVPTPRGQEFAVGAESGRYHAFDVSGGSRESAWEGIYHTTWDADGSQTRRGVLP